MEAARFTDEDLSLLAQCCERAEELTGDFFRLASFGPRRYLYQVATESDLSAAEQAPSAFAQLCRYEALHPEPGQRRRVGRFYRVCLQDGNILGAARRAASGFDLDSLLLYVMTHELIHVVRFEQFQHPFATDPGGRAEEESVVHGITYELLDGRDDAPMARLLEYYRHHRMPHLF
jgi:hypothetical protein